MRRWKKPLIIILVLTIIVLGDDETRDKLKRLVG